MEALGGLADIELTVAADAKLPEWFLRASCSAPLKLHRVQTDVGLVQHDPFAEDIPATLAALSGFYPLAPRTLESLAGIFSRCDLVVCDISPAGILAAREAGVASVLLENFTWDWIYEGYRNSRTQLQPFIGYLSEVNSQADYRVRTIPFCGEAEADLTVQPVARPFRQSRETTRQGLDVSDTQQMVLVSMGGMAIKQLPVERMQAMDDVVFVVSGCTGGASGTGNIRLLSPDCGFLHPDLALAADAVVAKAGYSTLAETYHADTPFGYVCRQGFRETEVLAGFIREEMNGLEIGEQEFRQGGWIDRLERLFALGGKGGGRENGAVQCARFLHSLLSGG